MNKIKNNDIFDFVWNTFRKIPDWLKITLSSILVLIVLTGFGISIYCTYATEYKIDIPDFLKWLCRSILWFKGILLTSGISAYIKHKINLMKVKK